MSGKTVGHRTTRKGAVALPYYGIMLFATAVSDPPPEW